MLKKITAKQLYITALVVGASLSLATVASLSEAKTLQLANKFGWAIDTTYCHTKTALDEGKSIAMQCRMD